MNKDEARDEIRGIFEQFRRLTLEDEEHLRTLRQGKLFELYVVAKLVEDLKSKGCDLDFKGKNIRFKQAPGKLLFKDDPHFVIRTPRGTYLFLFVDIEFCTLGYDLRKKNSAHEKSDRSVVHELDIVLVYYGADENPTHKQIVLAVECKSVEKLEKNFVREALGLRRELSLLKPPTCKSRLSYVLKPESEKTVPAKPASEFWLAFIDPDGKEYRQSPAQFGIELKHYDP